MELNTTKIKLLLAEQEMNQADLAIKCGLTRQQISEVLCRKTCSLKTLGRIAKAIGIPVSDIVTEDSRCQMF